MGKCQLLILFIDSDLVTGKKKECCEHICVIKVVTVIFKVK